MRRKPSLEAAFTTGRQARPWQVEVGVRKRLIMVLPARKLAAPTVTLELTLGRKPPTAADEVVGMVAIGLSGTRLANVPAVALSRRAGQLSASI